MSEPANTPMTAPSRSIRQDLISWACSMAEKLPVRLSRTSLALLAAICCGPRHPALADPAASASPSDASVCKPISWPADGGPFSWPVVVFFDAHSDALTARGRLMLDAFARKATELHVGKINMEGHVDAAENDADDRSLDARRVKAITTYLANKSLRVATAVALVGNRLPLIPDTRGAPEAQNRFVMVTVRGSYDDYTHQADRILLCRRWTLANCIGQANPAPAEQCRSAIDFLVRGDHTARRLDAP